jgi:hypothetical protein
MALIPLKIPAGFYRTGTELDASGRWRDGSLVRWRDGSLRPIGGWRVNENIPNTLGVSANNYAPRTMHTWQSISGTRYVASGSANELVAVLSSGTKYDITPTDLTAGTEDAAVNIGYGYGFYGAGTYGTPRPDTGNIVEATTWSIDNWGEYLVACSTADGDLIEWQLEATAGSELVADGDFAASTGWTLGIGWAVVGGVAKWTGTTAANLEQTVGSLTDGEKYYLTLRLIDPDADADPATIPSAKVKVLGTNTSTVLLDKTLSVGTNTYQFYIDDTSVDIQIYAASDAEPEFHVDDVSLKLGKNAEIIANAPTSNKGLIVTEERFIFALGAGGNPRKVQWCDRENNTLWAPAATNEAGDIELQTSGQIETAIRTRGQTLIITDVDAHTARYIGPPYVYGFERVGTSCGIISRQAAADVDMGVFWMGNGGFYRFDGNLVSEIPCDVHDYVFSDMNTSQKSKTWAFTNGQFGEIWWFYASSNSTEIDRYVAFDYKENHWLIGNLSRTSGASRGVFEYPMLLNSSSVLHDHEVGISYAVNGVEQSVFAESGPISIGNGDNIMQVTDLIPDEKTQGDVDVIFKSRYYPNDTEYTHGPYTPSSPTAVRFSGRQIRMRVEGDAPYAAWRVGTMRVDAKAGGRR